ncbi:MAG: hypothetical protein JXR03_08530 [Cyclobacteriaceae bacterium]
MKKLIFSSLILFLVFSSFASAEDSLATAENSIEIIHTGNKYVRVYCPPVEKGVVYIKISSKKNEIMYRDYLNYKQFVRKTYDTSRLPVGQYKVEVYHRGELLSTKDFSVTYDCCPK